MKRVVMVVSSFPKLSETFIINKFLGFLELGWDVYIVCNHIESKDWGRFPALVRNPDIRRRVIKSWPVSPRWLVLFLFPWALGKVLVNNFRGVCRYSCYGWRRLGSGVLKHFYLDSQIIYLKPDLIHFEFGALAVDRMHLKELLDCRIIVSFRGYDLNFAGLDNPNYYKLIWEQADGLHFLGQDLWKRAQRRGCPTTKRIKLIPPAIDTGLFSCKKEALGNNTTEKDRPLRILSVGRLEWKKGYEYAMQAVRIALDAGISCEYYIIGGGQYLGPLGFVRHLLGLEAQVHFLGPLPPAEVKLELERADIFLHAAVSEGFGNAVLEAQAMGIPVVTSDAGGLPENVSNGETGFVVSRRNPKALAEKLILLARHPDLRYRLGQAGRQRVLAHFRLENQVRNFAEFYEQVMREDGINI